MTSRVSLSVRRVGGTATPDLPLKTLRVVDEAGAHLIARATSFSSTYARFNEGDPVVLTWGLADSPFASLMYVHRITDATPARSTDSSYDLLLVGSSWPLKSSNPRVLKNTNASRILSLIAKDHGLSASFTATNRPFNLFVSRKSDWLGLRDLAQRVGGLLRVDGTTVRIMDMNDGLQDLRGVPVYDPKFLPAENVSVSRVKQDMRRREAAVVNPTTLQVAVVDDELRNDPDELLLRERPSVALGSVSEAQQDLRAKRLSERFREVGEVRGMQADPRIRPGTVIGFRNMTPAKNGYWTVTKADHTFSENTVVSDLSLGRSPEHPRGAPSGTLTYLVPSKPTASPTLRRGRWVSS